MTVKIKNKEYSIKTTHSNNSGSITVFIQSLRGSIKSTSFNLNEFDSVESFIISKFSAKILNL